MCPVIGTLPELLTAMTSNTSSSICIAPAAGLEALETVRRTRPDIRPIVIGPEGDEELVLNSIIAGARAYLGLSAGPEMVRKAIDVVTSGSIWAPRRLFARSDRSPSEDSKRNECRSSQQLTPREQQVLELILKAHSTREIANGWGSNRGR